MFHILGIDHLVLRTVDVARMLHFYVDDGNVVELKGPSDAGRASAGPSSKEAPR